MKLLEEQVKSHQSLDKQFVEQEERIQLIREEEEGRKKKFVLVRNQYEQKLSEAKERIEELERQLHSV